MMRDTLLRIVIGGCILNCVPAFAFLNVESIRMAAEAKEGVTGSLGLKVDGQSGNSEKFASELTTLNLYRRSHSEYLAAGKYRYGESFSRKDAHEGHAHLRYTHDLPSIPPAWESFVQTEFNEFKRLKRRDVYGTGLRFRLSAAGEKDRFFLGTGAFYEEERFTSKAETQDQSTFRGNLYVSYVRALTETVSASVIAYYQPSLTAFSNTRAQLDSGLQVTLSKRLSLILEYD
ncbi:MAG: DUF481 domain-containing protein, partial [Bdellovibrionales bacterium]